MSLSTLSPDEHVAPLRSVTCRELFWARVHQHRVEGEWTRIRCLTFAQKRTLFFLSEDVIYVWRERFDVSSVPMRSLPKKVSCHVEQDWLLENAVVPFVGAAPTWRARKCLKWPVLCRWWKIKQPWAETPQKKRRRHGGNNTTNFRLCDCMRKHLLGIRILNCWCHTQLCLESQQFHLQIARMRSFVSGLKSTCMRRRSCHWASLGSIPEN